MVFHTHTLCSLCTYAWLALRLLSRLLLLCRRQLVFALQVVRNEGVKSLFKGAGANILRAVAGAGVLSGYDQMQVLMFGKKFGGGE